MKKKKDIVGEAARALSQTPVPTGPPQQTVDQTIKKLTKAAGIPGADEADRPVGVITRIMPAKHLTKIAAAAVLPIALRAVGTR